MVVEGAISNIVDFGAFVDLNGIDGLIHISELSWSHVNHPSEILNIGDVVPVKVLDIDRDRQRISLGLKQTQEDPWQRVISTYRIGDELEGKVTKVVAFGAFVEILDGVEGLVHISELAHHHVENPREVVDPGQEVKVKILEIDEERRRLSLSVKRVEGQELPLRTLGDTPPEQHVTEGDFDNAPEYALSDDVFAADAPPAPELGAVDAPAEDMPEVAEAPMENVEVPEAPAPEPEPEAPAPEPEEAPAPEPEAPAPEPEEAPAAEAPGQPDAPEPVEPPAEATPAQDDAAPEAPDSPPDADPAAAPEQADGDA
jgi:small subunit ribosomal protein S1